MKKQSLLFILVALSSFAFAQSSSPSFGIKAGVTNSGLRGRAVNSLQGLIDYADGAVATTNRTGFFAGGYASIPVSDNFSIEPGLYYSQKGYALQGSFAFKGAAFLSANAKARLNTSYIDVPLLAKVNVNGLQLFAGPQVSYLAGANLHATAGALGFNFVNSTTDAKNQFNQWDVALTGGAGYQFANGFNVSASYDYGLSKVDKGQSFNAYNRSVKLGFGFRF